MESQQVTPVDSIKDVVQSSVYIPEFEKHLKEVGGHIGRNVVEITIKMKTNGGSCGVMVNIVGNGHGEMSSNPG